MKTKDELIFILENSIKIDAILQILINNGLTTKEDFEELCEKKLDEREERRLEK